MSRVTVLGIGNRLLCDDGIGNYIVEELMLHNQNQELNFVVGETDVDFCIDIASKSSNLIIVDAMFLGKNPGEVSLYSISGNVISKTFSLSQHNFHLLDVLGQNINIPRGYIIGIEPYEFTFSAGLSPVLEQKFPSIIEETKDYIKHVWYQAELNA